MHKKFDYKFIKFIFVGLLNTAFGYGIYALCIYSGLHYALAVLISTILGVIFNFKTTGVIVFKNNDNKRIFRFIAVYIFMCSLSILLLKILLILGLKNMYINNAIIIIPTALTTYVIMKNYVFSKAN